MKKLFAVFMAILIVFSISVPSFATELNPSNSSVGASSTAEHTVESSYRITIPAYIQATQTEKFPTASDDEEKIAIAESLLEEVQSDAERIVNTYNITYYSAILLLITEESDELVVLAKQGDDAIENAVEAIMSSEFGTDEDGNPITDINDYFNVSMGITLRELAMYIEYGTLSVPEQFENAVYYDVTAKDVLIDDMKELRVTVSYDNILSDTRGAELNYNIYNKYTCVNNGDVVLKAASGNPEKVYSTEISAMVEPVRYAGTFTDTVTFNASLEESIGAIYEIGATQSDYVLAVFNKDFTKVVIRPNGDNSDGLMKDFYNNEYNPMKDHIGTLKAAEIESGVKNIGLMAFGLSAYEYNNSSARSVLSSITLSDTVETIGNSAFMYSAIKEIMIPSSVKEIGTQAFSCSSLEHIEICPNSISTIQNGMFSSSALKSIIIPDGVRTISDGAFAGCHSLETVTIADSVTYLGTRVFYQCEKLSNIKLPNSMGYTIYDDTFYNCSSLKNITIPYNVRYVTSNAFSGCTSLESAVFENSKSLSTTPFRGCPSLKNIRINANDANYCDIDGVVFSKDKTVLFSCPQGKEGEYIVPDYVTEIGYGAFQDCSLLTNIIIPDSVTSIGGEAFENTGYYNNEDNWENDVLYIGNHLIKAKGSISGEYAIKDGTKTIVKRAFSYCSSLTSVTIPESVTSIDTKAFESCGNLKTIYGYSGSYAETFAAKNGYIFIDQN